MVKLDMNREYFANKILVANDMLKIPVDLELIATTYGIEIYYQELPADISGAIRYMKDTDSFQILIKSNDSKENQRFTLAHELSHYFLHKDLLMNDEMHVDVLYRNTDSSISQKNEEDADYMAGALLMDKMLLEKMYSENNSIKELANAFKVSESAMTVRLLVLGLV